MIVFKSSDITLHGVLMHSKHASIHNLKAYQGEIILVQQTKSTLKKGQKSIRWAMDFVRVYADENNESDRIWGKHWPYIIECQNLRSIEPFDMHDLQVSDKDYDKPMSYGWVERKDELVINEWLEVMETNSLDSSDVVEEFNENGKKDLSKYIEELNLRFSGSPDYKDRVVRQITRPTALKQAIIERDGSDCKICKTSGFTKKNGKPYCELHHMIELYKQAPLTLQSWNILILCPTCHKKIHYGKTKVHFLNPGWELYIDGTQHVII